MPIGHSGSDKADSSVQRIAILLARNGLAALPYDPIGQPLLFRSQGLRCGTVSVWCQQSCLSLLNMCIRTIGVLQELGRSCRFLGYFPDGATG